MKPEAPLHKFFHKRKKQRTDASFRITSTLAAVTEAPLSEEVVDLTSNSTIASAPRLFICEGSLPDYRTAELQELLVSYCQHATIASITKYKGGVVNSHTNLFSKECTKKGVTRVTKKGSFVACNNCFALYVSQSFLYNFINHSLHLLILVTISSIYYQTSSGKKMRQTVRDRGIHFIRMHELLTKSEITPTEQRELSKFTNTSDSTLTNAGIDLKERIRQANKFFKTLQRSKAVDLVKKSSGYMPGIDSFCQNFVRLYQENKEFRSSLLVGLCQGYASKMDGETNPVYQVS